MTSHSQQVLDNALTLEQMRLDQPTLTIEPLVHAYFADVYRLSFSMLEDEREAEDVAQETFIAAIAGLERFRGDSKVKTWLFGIAINLCRTRRRKLRARHALQLALEGLHFLHPKQRSPEELTEYSEARLSLWQAVRALDEKHRLPVLLHYIHEMSVPEISEALATEPGTIYSRLHYARKKLHFLLTQTQYPSS